MILELHILQNFAPSCLNRDDTNAPKDCEFGGYRRARISSQCIKRSIRQYFVKHADDLSLSERLGKRTRLLHKELVNIAVAMGKDRAEAEAVIRYAMKKGAGKEGLKVSKDDRTNVLLFLDPKLITPLGQALLTAWEPLKTASSKSKDVDEESSEKDDESGKPGSTMPKELRKNIQAFFKEATKAFRAADIALFGRMLAEIEDVNVDAACQVAHAISTNKVDMEMDYFTAVDDLQKKGDVGAAMVGIVEFNSSCFYRYSLLDTDQLLRNLGDDRALANAAILAFARASIFAIPTGKQTSMAAQNLPVYVRAIVRDGSAPRSLANAFLQPARPDGREEKDLALVSIEMLERHHDALNAMYGATGVCLDRRSSIYADHRDDTVDELIGRLGEVLG